jgi:hypothetical protein
MQNNCTGPMQLLAQVLSRYSWYMSKYYHRIYLERLKKAMKTSVRTANEKAPSKYNCTTLLLHQPTWQIATPKK